MIKVNVSLTSARMEGAVVQTIKDWATANPNELVAFDRQQKLLRSQLKYKNAMGLEGRMAHTYEIPVTLNRFMSVRFGHDWLDNKEVKRHFFDAFKIGRVGITGRGKQWVKMAT